MDRQPPNMGPVSYTHLMLFFFLYILPRHTYTKRLFNSMLSKHNCYSSKLVPLLKYIHDYSAIDVNRNIPPLYKFEMPHFELTQSKHFLSFDFLCK